MSDNDELLRLMAARYARKYALLDLQEEIERRREMERLRKKAAKVGVRKRRSDKFLASPEWRAMRERVFALHGKRCQKCGSDDEIQVDHIKPRSKFPDLALDIENLQVLCWPCNREKNFTVIADYRPPRDAPLLSSVSCSS